MRRLAGEAAELGCDILTDGVEKDERGLFVITIIVKAPSQAVFEKFDRDIGSEMGLGGWMPVTDRQVFEHTESICWKQGADSFVEFMLATGKHNQHVLNERANNVNIE